MIVIQRTLHMFVDDFTRALRPFAGMKLAEVQRLHGELVNRNCKIEAATVILTLPVIDSKIKLAGSCGNKLQICANEKCLSFLQPTNQGSITGALDRTLNCTADGFLSVRVAVAAFTTTIGIDSTRGGNLYLLPATHIHLRAHPTGTCRNTDMENGRSRDWRADSRCESIRCKC